MRIQPTRELPVFRFTRAPALHRRTLDGKVEWRSATWSASLLDYVTRNVALLTRSRPLLRDVPGCEPYQTTYEIAPSALGRLDRDGELTRLAESLLTLKPRGELLLLSALINRVVTPKVLHSLLAALRTRMVSLAGNPAAALMTPVSTTRRDAGFALHADLFKESRLLLVFDQIPEDGSGATLLLPTPALMKAAEATSMPLAARQRLGRLFQESLKTDAFDELYDLLHSTHHAWTARLNEHLVRHQLRLRLRRGEGYLLNDRNWLHGRQAASQPVTSRRFRRLVF